MVKLSVLIYKKFKKIQKIRIYSWILNMKDFLLNFWNFRREKSRWIFFLWNCTMKGILKFKVRFLNFWRENNFSNFLVKVHYVSFFSFLNPSFKIQNFWFSMNQSTLNFTIMPNVLLPLLNWSLSKLSKIEKFGIYGMILAEIENHSCERARPTKI